MPQPQPAGFNRKSPIQGRAKQTVATILEATARILTEEGSERLTTNHLARRAGFSIGTIYQYFPNREAIVLALVERQRAEVERRVKAVLAGGEDAGPEARIAQIVRTLHQAFAVHRAPQRRLVQALLRLAATQGIPTPPDTVARAIFTIWRDAKGGRAPGESDVFVLTQSLFETLRQATLQSSPLLGTVDFEEALLRMVFGCLRGASQS
ncbi:AcrR family transcriptional regulator [Rhodopseudomonas rhenobacensis]|uniref:AcrR family transcriptional regulator n=1 Tax=Rhodopseudomonas rhenobacensis TaxID=87461 RepID=A0A7W7Z9E5_9BRAD|nr:AcrR family transcriptional regulator [Rhodopseudomonas rhenobacensis]